MAEVISTLPQLINAFKTHKKVAAGTPEEYSHILLLFYAVECGLKAKYLKEFKGLNTTDFVTLPIAKKYGYGHDIWEWVKILKMPSIGFVNNSSRPLVQMHERLRYGTFTKSSVENDQIKFLKHLSAILKNEL